MHSEVVGRNQEVEVPSQALLEAAVESSRDLGDRSTRLAHQVKVLLVGEVVDGWPVPEVSVLVGMLTMDALGEFLGGHVAGSLEQRSDHGSALNGGPATLGP